MPPSTVRESFLIVVSTRPINLAEEAERSTRLSAASLRGLLGRVYLIDASKGDLANLIQFGKPTGAGPLRRGEEIDEAQPPPPPDPDRIEEAAGPFEPTSDGRPTNGQGVHS